ncbi:MAG: protein translocase subunit SecD [Thermomicrobiales bacterium]|jgi:protein-export membrane protein SecD|nr:MAG: protein translocase subunit SecD [Thermomicrobiales bacterium]
MRKAGPILILLIGVLALAIDLAPGLRLPDSTSAEGTWRTVETKLGLDLSGGLRVEYQALPVEGKQPGPADMAVIKDIVERRVNTTGVSEPVVTTQGSDRVVIELPGVTDPEAVRKLVGTTGRLDFVPLGSTQMTDGQAIDLETFPPLFSGDQVSSATVGTDQNGRPAVDFVLKDEGRQKFADYTRDNVGSYFAITLDGTVISAPVIQNSIPNGNVQITGGGLAGFAAKDATELVTVLKFGSLPFPIVALSSETISATLGTQFLVQTVLAGLVGISLVFAFMLIYYRLPGAVASFALIYYAIVMYAIFRLVPVTLTLAGIAGFVLSVGMAVDANILIFERMKEELRVGKSLPAAVEAGFNRAWNSILDSNVSSLITATILYAFGSSVIRGFALVLIIGVLVSMFSAIVVTRTILRWVVRQEWAKKPSRYGLRDDEFVSLGAVRPTGRREARERV